VNNIASVFRNSAVLFLCAFLYTVPVSAQHETKSNAELLDTVIERSVRQLSENLPGNSPVIVQVHFPEYEWFLRHRAIEVLTDMGYTVTGFTDEIDDDRRIVEIGVERFGINYSDIKRRSLFGSRTVTRTAEGVFSFRINDGTAERVIRISESIRDIIPYRKRADLENPALPFTHAELPSGSLIERYLGPAVIVAATGMVVYLFFSVRS
jgi:hypothetical protein